MSLLISGDLRLAKVSQPLDADAQAYVNAVEVADRQRIEDPVRFAINNFVIGCKADGIWSAIKASCILAGARTLTGALVPLVGAAPTPTGFSSGNYDRKTGLVRGSGTALIDSNRNNNADPQNSNHNAVFVTSTTSASPFMGTQILVTGANTMFANGSRNRTATGTTHASAANPGLVGHSRNLSSSFIQRVNGVDTVALQTSQTPHNANLTVFGYVGGGSDISRLAFYSIGESLSLALLDARVTTLINAFAAAIP